MIFVVAKPLHDSSQGVLEKFETDMRKMARDVRKVKVLGTDELNRRPFEHSIMLFTNESCIFDSFLENVMNVLRKSISEHRHMYNRSSLQLSCI